MKTITFYSYKGGVGRSLALSNVANRLSEFGKKVCIMDFDLEAPGLHLKFDSNISSRGVKKGLVDYICEFTETGLVPSNIFEFVTEINFERKAKRENIYLIAAGNTLIKEYWIKLSSIDWNQFFYSEGSYGVDFFYNLKEQIKEQIKPDFLLIDSRTGITDISGITMTILADEVVLFGANNKENLEGIIQVIKTLAIPSNSIRNEIPKINFVLSRIPFFPNSKDKHRETNAKNAALRTVNQSLIKSDITNFQLEKVLVIHSDSELELEEKFKISYNSDLPDDTLSSPIGLDYLNLFEELTLGILTKIEKKAFNDFIKVESLIEKASATSNKAEKIRLLIRALDINPYSDSACYQLGIVYFDTNDYQKALEFFDRSLQLNKKEDNEVKLYRAICYRRMEVIDVAKAILEDVLKDEPDSLIALSNLNDIYYSQSDYQKAFEYQKIAMKYHPDNEHTLNSFGNIYRVFKDYENAFFYIYKALEVNPQSVMATGTLAEIYAEVGNKMEFYKNLELCFSFGMQTDTFQGILEKEKVYRQFYNDERFLSMLDKYNIDVDWSKITSEVK